MTMGSMCLWKNQQRIPKIDELVNKFEVDFIDLSLLVVDGAEASRICDASRKTRLGEIVSESFLVHGVRG